MPLPTGEKLGPYEILGLIGTGGMGEVYRARDPRLGRDVAIKVSAERFTERFEREARVIASLNHPNVCTLHDVGPNYLVMELVEGPTLAERIHQGAIPFDEAVRVARQIADALEAAHDKGIVHRDLKPGNIKIKPDGFVKVLDFGLAKLGGIATAVSDSSPTLTAGETQAGVILGTAAYMPPEQAKGREVDKRADIWAFGVVFHEMLTGKRLFRGETTTETLAAVIERAPRWDNVPAQARPLLRRCLEKDPKRRLRDIGEAMAWLESPPEPVPAPATARTRWLWPGIAVVLLAATALLGFLYLRPKPPAAAEIVRFEIAQPPNVTFSDGFAVSPDGRKLAFVASSGAVPQIWVRFMDTLETRPLAGTDGAVGTPFWSPDSRHIVFYAQTKLQKIEASGGPAQTLCGGLPASIRGGFWTRDNKIVFATNSTNGLWQVSAAGGACSPFSALASGENRHLYPTLLPDGRHFVFARSQSSTIGGIYLGSLDAQPNEQASMKLLPDISATAYVPSMDSATVGYLLFVRGGTLMAQPFDNQRLEMEGEAVPIAERVPSSGVSASATGILVYRNGAITGADQLTWFDRKGKELGAVGDPTVFEVNSPPALSPDGKRVAFARTDSLSGNTDIWLFEFARGVSSRFTFDPGQDINPVWSSDSSRIAFAGERSGVWGIYQKASNLAGGEELLYKSGNLAARPATWSRDGRFLLYSAGSPYDIGLIPLNTTPSSGASDRKPQEILHTQFNERGARLSPDGRFFAYTSNSSGRDEVYVQTFDASSSGPAGGTVMVSKDGGLSPRWRGDGREIFYSTAGGNIMSVDVSTNPVFQTGVPKLLFRPPTPPSLFWDATSDGQRFLLVVTASPASATPYTVVQNWQAALRK